MKPLSIFDSDYRPSRLDRIKAWLSECPGGWSTLILLACFVAGMVGLWLIWNMGEAVNTAVRG